MTRPRSIASSATSVVIGHVADHTSSIRLGAGVMLPNHTPLTIAEQFGTLETLHPGRIDLGLGRAPATTMRALRRDATSADRVPQDVVELQGYLKGRSRVPGVQAVPENGGNVPLHILGSSDYGAQLAARLGLPYGFASQFAPAELRTAVARYRAEFRPSEQLSEPYVIVGANVVAADDAADAQEQFATVRRRLVRSMITRRPGTPEYSDPQIDAFLTTANGKQVADMLRCTAVGTMDEIRRYLEEFAAPVYADEVIVVPHGTDTPARLRSVERTATAVGLSAPETSREIA